MIKRLSIFTALLLLSSEFAFGEAPVALISSSQGTVQILKSCADSDQKDTMLFEGKKYRFSMVKIGQKVFSGEVLMTGSDGKIKIIFEHGDVAVLGPSTSLVIPTVGSTAAGDKTMELMYGRVRAVIDKDGPLSGLKIKTPTAVAGVRGTDLSVSYNPAGQGTQVEVIRGEVEVKIPDQVKPVEVKTGEVAKVHVVDVPVADTPAAKPVITAEVTRATSEDLNVVQEASTVAPEKEKTAAITVEEKKEIAAAEKSAGEIAIKDIQRYDPKAAQTVAQNEIKSADDLNKFAIDQVRQKAPEPVAEAKVELTPEDLRRRSWAWSFGALLTEMDAQNGVCGGGNSSCSVIPLPGIEVGLNKTYVLFNSRFTFRAGAALSIRDEYFNNNISSQNGGGTFVTTQYGLDIPLQFGYDINSAYSVHFGPIQVLSLGISTICPSGTSCSAYAQSNVVPEVSVSKVFNEKWRGEVAFQFENSLMSIFPSGGFYSYGYGNGGPNVKAYSLVFRADRLWF